MRALNTITLILASLLLTACSAQTPSRARDDAIASEIRLMAADDQRLDHLVMQSDPKIKEPGFFDRKEALQRERTARCVEIFELVGFPAPPLFERSIASDFWLLVQHSDNDPMFQQQVLDAIDMMPDGIVSASERAYLVDRVRVNTNRPQLFGTQVSYDFEQARAYPENLEAVADVDARRAEAELEPLWEYMNSMSELNHRMNKSIYEAKGIMNPWRYPSDYSDW